MDRIETVTRLVRRVSRVLVVVTGLLLLVLGVRELLAGDAVFGAALIMIGAANILAANPFRSPSAGRADGLARQSSREQFTSLVTQLIAAGFGLIAIIATLLIIFGPRTLSDLGWTEYALHYTALGVVVVVGMVFLSILMLMRRLILPRLQQEVEERAQQLSERQSLLLAQLREAAAQEERNRLARDLHDTIKQQLFSINIAAATAQSLYERDPVGAAQHIQHVRDLTQAAMTEMKALLTQLRPQPLATIGLIEAIREQLEALHFRAEVNTTLHHDGFPDEALLFPGTQETVFRVIQEALSNVARHARARHVQVSFGQEMVAGRDWLTVTVADDGQGFDPATSTSGMGMTNMLARIEALGGELAVRSAPHAGTTIQFRIPLAEKESQHEKEVRMREERFQHIFTISGLTSLNGMVFVIGGLSLTLALQNAPLYFAGIGILGVLIGVGLLPVMMNRRRRARPWATHSIWQTLLRFYDLLTVGFLLSIIAWVTFSLQAFALTFLLGVGFVGVAIALIRTHRILNDRVAEWATQSMLRTQVRESWFSLGFAIGFQVLVYSGLFGSMQAVNLFHDTLDRSWFVSLLAIGYPLVMIPYSVIGLVISYHHLRRLTALKGESSVAEPVMDSGLRRLRSTAVLLTLAYHILCISVGVLIEFQVPFGGVAAIVALGMLVGKWWIERSLTARIAEWSSRYSQLSALTMYGTFLFTYIFSFLGLLIGAAIAMSQGGVNASIQDAVIDSSLAGLPTAAPWMIFGFDTWWLGIFPYLLLQTINTWRRLQIVAREQADTAQSLSDG